MFSWLLITEIVKESLRFAWNGLKANILRTLLSTLGIIIGVFTIISILTFIDSLSKSIRDSVSELGGDVIYIQKWPWIFSNDYPWWKFINRPDVSYQEMVLLRKRLKNYSAVTYIAGIYNKSIAYGDQQVNNIGIDAITYEYNMVFDFKFDKGRYFSENESYIGSPKIILGSEIAKNLFPNKNPIGKTIKTLNKKFVVIGVLKKEGSGFVSIMRADNRVFIPLNYARYLYGSNLKQFDTTIKVKGDEDEEIETVESEIRGVMRSIRRLSPGEEDNFALNKASLINNKLNEIFRQLSVAAWVLAGFSILVGGFGTANIMFVSVKERTFLIGIEKALGSPRYFILSQFLGESVILCIVGGIVGLFLVIILILIVNTVQTDLHLVLTFKNVGIGILLSTIIGVLAGLIPSYKASRLDPIIAISNVF